MIGVGSAVGMGMRAVPMVMIPVLMGVGSFIMGMGLRITACGYVQEG